MNQFILLITRGKDNDQSSASKVTTWRYTNSIIIIIFIFIIVIIIFCDGNNDTQITTFDKHAVILLGKYSCILYNSHGNICSSYTLFNYITL